MPVSHLPPEALYNRCPPERFSFATTQELEPLTGLFGHDRAREAIRFGTRIDHPGYNMFVLGAKEAQHGRSVLGLLRHMAAEQPLAPDWAYVTNFGSESAPRALSLKPATGRKLRDGVAATISALRRALPAVFQSDQYNARRQAIEEEFQQRYSKALSDVQVEAEARGIALVNSQQGITLAPLDGNGEIMSQEAFNALDAEEQSKIEQQIQEVRGMIEGIIRTEIPQWESERGEALTNLNAEFADLVVAHYLDRLKTLFQDQPAVTGWLEAMALDIVSNVHTFLPQADTPKDDSFEQHLVEQLIGIVDPMNRYAVNLIVDQTGHEGAPVVYFDHPTLNNLVGRVEARSRTTMVGAEASLVRGGALHAANGGYLVIDATKILEDWTTWEALKRALDRALITVESINDVVGYYNGGEGGPTLPEPIPLNVKVVMFGPSNLYHMLVSREPDFADLFKVQVEFDDVIDRSEDTDLHFARMIAAVAQENDLRPLDPSGVARMIEFAAREADDGERLSLHVGPIRDLLCEADFQAGDNGAPVISAVHVDAALDAQRLRADRWRERQLARVKDQDRLISTDGGRVGQINALFVHSLPNYRWGGVARVTARVRAGSGGVMAVDRAVGFGRRIYAKGGEIISSWLLSKFARDRPVQFAASLVFEQNYGPIDGDSASSTELYALLSALADVPISQAFAVTGSVNQFGEVQVIGGVNEKIEGFFDVCAADGLTGEQGVVIPKANVRDLMLRADIVEAARRGLFRIYPVETIEEGIEVLTGVEAGREDDTGGYPVDSIYGRVQQRLLALSGYRQGDADTKTDTGTERPRNPWFFGTEKDRN